MYSVGGRCLHKIGLLLLNVIHAFYCMYISVVSVFSEFLCKTQTFCDRVGLFPRHDYSDSVSTVDYIKCFQKLPKHLAIIIGSESIFYLDLVKFILWSNQFGIKYISFCDENNSIDPHTLYTAVCRHKKENLRRIKWGKSFDSLKELTKMDLNGYKWEPELQVDVFRIEDGQRLFVEAVEDLCRKRLPASSIDLDLLDGMFQGRIGVPDPDLAFICGDVCSTYGYLPWQIRVTEFMHVQTHHGIKLRDFVSLLERYNRCEQRFGK